jgi:hypothetical protein
VGAYHFLRPVSIPAQVDFFLKIAAPDGTTLLALDHEDERVPLINGKEFLLRVEHAVGRKDLNGSTQHFILEGKDGVYSEGSAISSRFHSGREGGAVKSLAERGSRSNDRTGV